MDVVHVIKKEKEDGIRISSSFSYNHVINKKDQEKHSFVS